MYIHSFHATTASPRLWLCAALTVYGLIAFQRCGILAPRFVTAALYNYTDLLSGEDRGGCESICFKELARV